MTSEHRFAYYLQWNLIATFGSGLLYGGLALISGSLLAGLVALTCLICGSIFLPAWFRAKQGQINSALVIHSVGEFLGAVLVVVILPTFWPTAALVALLATVAALPYVTGQRLLVLSILSFSFMVIAAVLGVTVTLLQVPAPPFLIGLSVAAFATAGVLIALLLWQFSNRLHGTIAQVQETNEALARQNIKLARADEEKKAQLEQQTQLLALVTTLETPVVPLAEAVLYAPVVGNLDSRRMLNLSERVLEGASKQQARMVLLDITGVPVMDTAVAHGILAMTQALRLIGCQVVISGISAQTAITMTHLGIMMDGIPTVRSPQEALAFWQNTAPIKWSLR
jgi:anti-anti-sigma regulatory factor